MPEKIMEQNKNTSGFHEVQADSTPETVRKFSYSYLTEIQHLKAHREVVKAIREQEFIADSSKMKAECREIISENQHYIDQIKTSLSHQLNEARVQKKLWETKLRESINHEWVEINSVIGLYIHKISKIESVL